MGIFDKSFHAVLLLHCFVAVGEPRLCGENRIEGLMHRVTELLLDIVRKATWYWAGRSSSNDLGGGDGANHLSVSLKNPAIFSLVVASRFWRRSGSRVSISIACRRTRAHGTEPP